MEENGMAEREIVEYPEDLGEGETSYYDEKTTRSRLGNWIWNAVLRLGKKAVMTGVVISFVPLVLPPLILVSAVVCALSVPFGVVFASYACTDKLMSKLMPSPPLVVQEYNQTVVLQEEEDDEEREVAKDEVEMRIELVGDTKSSDTVTDDEPIGGGHVSLLEEKKIRNDQDGRGDDGQNIKDGALEVQIDKATENIECVEKVADRKEEEARSSRDKIEKATVASTEDRDKKDSKKETSSSKETEKLSGKRKKTSKRHGKLSGEEKGIVVVPKEITDTEVVQETNDKERCPELNVGNADKLSADLKKMLDTRRVEDVGDSTGVLAGNGGGIDKVEHHAVTIYSDQGNKQRNYDDESKVLAGDGKLKHDEKIHNVKAEKVAGAVDGGEHSDEVDEEMIWKKMEAIRVVVGYKAPRRSSYLEELEALYLFTGIEPPRSNSVEFNNSLSLLMSVIGLK